MVRLLDQTQGISDVFSQGAPEPLDGQAGAEQALLHPLALLVHWCLASGLLSHARYEQGLKDVSDLRGRIRRDNFGGILVEATQEHGCHFGQFIQLVFDFGSKLVRWHPGIVLRIKPCLSPAAIFRVVAATAAAG